MQWLTLNLKPKMCSRKIYVVVSRQVCHIVLVLLFQNVVIQVCAWNLDVFKRNVFIWTEIQTRGDNWIHCYRLFLELSQVQLLCQLHWKVFKVDIVGTISLILGSWYDLNPRAIEIFLFKLIDILLEINWLRIFHKNLTKLSLWHSQDFLHDAEESCLRSEITCDGLGS